MKINELIIGKYYITSHNTVIKITQIRNDRVWALWPSKREYEVNKPEENIIEPFRVGEGDKVSFSQYGKYLTVTKVQGFSVAVLELNYDKPITSIYKINKMYKTNIAQVICKNFCCPLEWTLNLGSLKKNDVVHVLGNPIYEYEFTEKIDSVQFQSGRCRVKGKGDWCIYPQTIKFDDVIRIYKANEITQAIGETQMEKKEWKMFDKANLKAGMEEAKAEIAARQRAQAKAKYTELFNSLETVNSQIETLQVTKKEIEEALALFQ